MRILIVSAFSLKLNTSGTIQNLIIIEGLKKLGYEIDVLTTELAESHVAYDPTLSLENIDNYYELRLPNVYSSMRTSNKESVVTKRVKKIIKRIYNELEVFDGYKGAIADLDSIDFKDVNYDYIISTSDPKSSHLIAKAFIDKYNLQSKMWIQYWGDPLYIDISRQRKKILEARVKNAERLLLRDADKIIYATPFTCDAQKKLYPEYQQKMDYATQGYWEDYSRLEHSPNSKFTIGYFGNYNPNFRNIKPLYNAMSGLREEELLIAGSGMELENKENISVLGYLNHQKIREYENSCDLLVCILNNRGTQIPGKVYYYASFKKPLLVVVDGDYGEKIKEFLGSRERYIFCENQEDSIKNAILEIKKNTYNNFNEISELLTPEYMAKRILKEM